MLSGNWYYFYADGSLGRSAKIDAYEADKDGVRKVYSNYVRKARVGTSIDRFLPSFFRIRFAFPELSL